MLGLGQDDDESGGLEGALLDDVVPYAQKTAKGVRHELVLSVISVDVSQEVREAVGSRVDPGHSGAGVLLYTAGV